MGRAVDDAVPEGLLLAAAYLLGLTFRRPRPSRHGGQPDPVQPAPKALTSAIPTSVRATLLTSTSSDTT